MSKEEVVPKKFLSMSDIDIVVDEKFFELNAWSGVLLIGSLTADSFIEWQTENEGPAKRTAGLRLIVDSLCGASSTCPACLGTEKDHKGPHSRIGSDKDLAMLRRKSVAETEKVVRQIVKLNELRVNEGAAAKND